MTDNIRIVGWAEAHAGFSNSSETIMAEKVKSYGAGVLFILFIGVLVWFAGSLHGGQDYDVRPEISVPEYKTDAARAIDAYEKMMNRYMDLTESQFKNVALDNQKTFEKLLEIQTDIARIDMRLERIEKKLVRCPRFLVQFI